jgi:hypothetical protein
MGGLPDNLGICGVILLAFDERLHILRRYQFDLMAKLDELPSPIMSAAAGLHHNDSRGLTRQKC